MSQALRDVSPAVHTRDKIEFIGNRVKSMPHICPPQSAIASTFNFVYCVLV